MQRIGQDGTRKGAAPVLLVTGTDTGVGKTVVAAGIARAIARAGCRVVAIKAVETGCGEQISPDEDGAILARATGQGEPSAALVRLRAPVTPALAADAEGIALDFDALVDEIAERARRADVAILEGAGGLFAPITWQHSALDLARALRARVLVVGADRLGTINHVLLTLRALEGLALHGLVLSEPARRDDSTSTNLASIVKHAESQGIALPDDLPRRCVELPRVADSDDAADRLGGLAGLLLEEAEPS